jgi:hypothetical protein
MRCKVRWKEAVSQVRLEFEHAEVSFQPAGSRETGSGIVIEAGGARLEILRVAGEDWIQAPRRSMAVPLREDSRELEVVVRLIDSSAMVPVRVDLRKLCVIYSDRANVR